MQPNQAFTSNAWTIVNVVLGGICWIALSAAATTYAVRSTSAHLQGKCW